MHKKQKNRLIAFVIFLSLISIAIAFVLYALRQNINLFLTPTQAMHYDNAQQIIRLGGYVLKNSVRYSGKTINFKVSDFKNSIPVVYEGVLPSLFREGQGVVLTGTLDKNKLFKATEVLAKHDEKYKPPILKEINHAI